MCHHRSPVDFPAFAIAYHPTEPRKLKTISTHNQTKFIIFSVINFIIERQYCMQITCYRILQNRLNQTVLIPIKSFEKDLEPKPSDCDSLHFRLTFFFSREILVGEISREKEKREIKWKKKKKRRIGYLRDLMAMGLVRTWKKKLAPWRNTTTPVQPRRKNSTIISVRLRSSLAAAGFERKKKAESGEEGRF